MPRTFLINASDRIMNSFVDYQRHHHDHQQQEHAADNAARFPFIGPTVTDQLRPDDVLATYGQRLQPYLYQLWSAVLASNHTLLQQRLPVTSSYHLPPPTPPPLDGAQVSVTSEQSRQCNPFVNCPPLTADVDTNRLYPRMNNANNSPTNSSNVSPSTAATRFNAFSINSFVSSCCNPSADPRCLADFIPPRSSQLAGAQVPERCPLACAAQQVPMSSTSARFRCAACHKSYSTVAGLSKHREFHCRASSTADQPCPRRRDQVPSGGPVKDQRCPQCDKAYTSASALKMHIRTHTLPCRCRLCGKAFSRPWLLQGHVRTHTGEKPFRCPHCQRAFADRSNLRAHLQTHYDVKQYHCDVCRRTFSRMSLLLKHRYSACAVADDAGNSVVGNEHAQKNEPVKGSDMSRVLSLIN